MLQGNPIRLPRRFVFEDRELRGGGGKSEGTESVAQLRNVMVKALARHPEARRAVVEALRA